MAVERCSDRKRREAMSFLNGLAEIFINSALSALGAGFQAMEDPQSFLKDDLPPNANAVAKWIQSRNRRACRQHARNEAAGLYSDLGALRRPRYERVCRPYLDSINEGPTTEGNYGPPFSGGQCSGKIYGTSLSGTICYRPAPTLQNPNPDIICLPLSETRACGTSGAIIGPVRLVQNEFSNGATRTYFIGQGPNRGAELSIAAGPDQEVRITVNSALVTLCPNQGADDCGDPDNEYEPPRYPPNLPPIGPPDTDNPPPGGDGGDDVSVDEDGNIRICENGDCSSPTSPGSGGDPSEDPGEEDGDPQENDPNNPNDDTIEGCAGEGRILTGLQINFTQVPLAVSGPLDYYRNVCFVGFGPDLSKIDLVIDGKLVRDGQFVIPDSEFCRCFRVVISPGWGLSVQAYSRPEKTE